MPLFLPIAEVCTLLWLGFTIQLLIRTFLGSKDKSSAKRQFSIAWWAYCIPIHLHGVLCLDHVLNVQVSFLSFTPKK